MTDRIDHLIKIKQCEKALDDFKQTTSVSKWVS